MSAAERERLSGEERATLLSHLQALRRVIIISLVAVIAAFLLLYTLCIDPLMAWLTGPISARGIQIIYTTVSEALVTKFKVGLIAGVIAASPVVILQVWGFLKPALRESERRLFRRLFFAALLLFLAGVAFCFFAVYTLAIDFFLVQGGDLATPMLSLDKYVSFMFGFIVPFGIAFQLPVALYMAARIGWTDAKKLASKRKYVILGVFVLAAVLTPPDVVSQIALGVPLCLLYEIGILTARLAGQAKRNSEIQQEMQEKEESV